MHDDVLYRLAQVSLGDILGADDRRANHCINDRRCDFLIADRYGMPLVAIDGSVQNLSHFVPPVSLEETVKSKVRKILYVIEAISSARAESLMTFEEREQVWDQIPAAMDEREYGFEAPEAAAPDGGKAPKVKERQMDMGFEM